MTQQPDSTPKVISGSDQAADEAPPPASKQKNTPARAGKDTDARKEPDYSARAAELEEELREVRNKAAGAETVRLRVEPDSPHSHMVFNGIMVSEDWTEVPIHAVPDLMEGAANAGVTLTQEETES
jgi:hypothetical protein